MASHSPTSWRSTWVAWSLVFVFHAGVIAVLASRHYFVPDEGAYTGLAKNLAEWKGFHLDDGSYWHKAGQPYTHFAPGWPFLLAIGYTLLGWTGYWLILWLVWCVNSLLIYDLARILRLLPRWNWALVGWLSLNPLMLFYHGHFMTESVVIGYNLALTRLGIRLLRQPNLWGMTGFAALAAAAHLTRSQCMLPVVAFWLCALILIPWKQLAKLLPLFIVVHLALLGPWLWRMHLVGATGLSTEVKLGINLYQFSGTPNDDPYGPEGGKFPLPEGIETMTPAERNSVFMKEAIRGITARPSAYLHKCLTRIRLLFSPVPNFYETSRTQYLIILGSSLVFYHLPLLLMLIGLIRQFPRDPSIWFLLVAVLIWYLFHVLVNASIRNRLPSDVWVATLAVALWTPRSMSCNEQKP